MCLQKSELEFPLYSKYRGFGVYVLDEQNSGQEEIVDN